VDDYLSEKEQVQKIREWWRENGPYVIAGLVLGIGGLVGWNYWKSYKIAQAEEAGAIYMQLSEMAESGDQAAAAAALADLEADYAGTPYLDQARLMMARMMVEKGEFEGAAAHLADVVESTSDPELERVARIRLARVWLAAGQHQQALDVLDLSRAGAFAARFHEIRGDTLASRGEDQAAIEEYRLALQGGVEGVVDRQAVLLKLDALGGSPDDIGPEPSGDA
jgi:predicted negative regulator of RcsB-dependent stress response